MFKPFQYFLTEEDGRCLTMNNGVLTTTAARTPLQHTPDGWQDIVLSWERDLSKHGIVRNFSLPLSFVLDGADILREVFYSQNIERKIFLIIQKLTLDIDSGSFSWNYKYLYKGELDFSTFKDTGDKVTINILEGGLSKLLKANEGTTQEIPFDDDFIFVKQDGILIKAKYQWFMPGRSSGGESVFPLMSLLDSNEKAFGIAAYSPMSGMDYPVDGLDMSSTEYFLSAFDLAEPTTGTFSAQINWTSTTNPLRFVLLNVLNTVTGAVTTIDMMNGASGPPGIYTLSKQVDIRNEYRFFLNINGFFTDFTLTLDTQSRYKTTYTKAHKPLNLYKKIGERISGRPTDWESNLLDANKNLAVTSFDAIRGIPTAVIKTSMNDFYDSFNAILCAGMSIEQGKCRIEERSRYYDSSNPKILGSIKNLEIGSANDLMANTFKIGYVEEQADDVNGKYSFNNTHLYSSVITRIIKEYTAVSKYISDPYVMELKRARLDDKNTTDNSTDNKPAIINTEEMVNIASFTLGFNSDGNKMFYSFVTDFELQPGMKIKVTGTPSNDRTATVLSTGYVQLVGRYVVLDATLTTESGVSGTIEILVGKLHKQKKAAYDNENTPDDFGLPYPSTVFNIEDLTPKRVLLRHGAWIRSIMRGFDNQKLTFKTTERNALLKTVKGGITIQEKADVSISSLAARLFLPVYFEFETDVPTDLADVLEASPNKCVQFDWNGTTYKGFIITCSLSPNRMDPQTFKVLAAPDINLKTFK